MTLDPDIGEDSDTITLNPYIYCGNNPVTNVDPDGSSFFLRLVGYSKSVIKDIVNFVFDDLRAHPVTTVLSARVPGIGSGYKFYKYLKPISRFARRTGTGRKIYRIFKASLRSAVTGWVTSTFANNTVLHSIINNLSRYVILMVVF